MRQVPTSVDDTSEPVAYLGPPTAVFDTAPGPGEVTAPGLKSAWQSAFQAAQQTTRVTTHALTHTLTHELAQELVHELVPEPTPQNPFSASLVAALATATPNVPATIAATDYTAQAPFESRLQGSPGSPAFASDLGVQLSLFARQGITHARLRLHPEEMGPLTVEIRLDGSNAQVHLAAQNQITRQALEQAVPSLAGALRESGLTLTGGGVSEQPRQPQPDARAQTQSDASQHGAGNGRQGREGSANNATNNTTNRANDSLNPAFNTGLNSQRNSPSWAGRRSVVDLVA